MKPVDTYFAAAEWQALDGDATAMAAILRDTDRLLTVGEREVLALMVERLAEWARGDAGGRPGRKDKAAGHPDVVRAVDRYEALLAEGRQKTEAKSISAEECDVSLRTIDTYLKLSRERAKLLQSGRRSMDESD